MFYNPKSIMNSKVLLLIAKWGIPLKIKEKYSMMVLMIKVQVMTREKKMVMMKERRKENITGK